MNKRTLALTIALTYPDRAFAGEAPAAVAESRALIARASEGQDVSGQIAELFARYPRLNEWAAQLLEDPGLLPPHLQPDEVRSFGLLPTPGEPVPADGYVCPTGYGTTWYRSSVSDAVPECPHCHELLVLLSQDPSA